MLAPVRERYAEITADPATVPGLLENGARKASGIASVTLGRCPGGDRPVGAAQLGKTRLKYQFSMSPRNLERAPWSNRTSSRTSTMNPMRIR